MYIYMYVCVCVCVSVCVCVCVFVNVKTMCAYMFHNDKGKHKKYAHISIHLRRKEKSILLFTNLMSLE